MAVACPKKSRRVLQSNRRLVRYDPMKLQLLAGITAPGLFDSMQFWAKKSRTVAAVAAFALLCVTALSHASGTETDKSDTIIALNASAELSDTLMQAFDAMGPDYKPRTEHFTTDGTPAYLNRLILEDSPYLLQHAHNPVNWYPWGEEAFAVAKAQNKPVFLSIGYATCHWCHVMERESFEHEGTAALINEHFIAIKVDREQRPDVDATYMTAVQMLTGSGGWPMSSFLTTDAKPFYAGTYWPRDQFELLLSEIPVVWKEQPGEVQTRADQVASALQKSNELHSAATDIGYTEIERAVERLKSAHDDQQGGFGPAPKFPNEPSLFLLLEQARQRSDERLLEVIDITLSRMDAGGIHDQVGGGFHRYSVDNLWLVPHFEKMLYNQAALSRIYAQGWAATNNPMHRRTAERALDYVLREMTSPEGVFYSATDADSDGGEGRFFVWTPETLTEVLGEKEAATAMQVWNVTADGNFGRSSILHLDDTLEAIAERAGFASVDALNQQRDAWSQQLLTARQSREHPLRDDKIITAWNGMMITALAEVGLLLNNPAYLDAAVRAATVIWTQNRDDAGQLKRAYYNGTASVRATQSDYAFLAEAFLSVFDVTGDAQWLERSQQLVNTMDALFLDPAEGGYFMGSQVVGGAALPVRSKERFDNAVPSGNSVALRVLTRLYHRTGDETYRDAADALLTTFSGPLNQYAGGFDYLLASTSELLNGETGEVRYSARGNVQARTVMTTQATAAITLQVRPGWHINAHEPLQEYLIGTEATAVASAGIKHVTYPQPSRQILGFERSELALLKEEVVIEMAFDEPLTNAPEITLNLQACNDTTCLAPETLRFTPTLAAYIAYPTATGESQ